MLHEILVENYFHARRKKEYEVFFLFLNLLKNVTVNTGTNSSASGFKPEFALTLPGVLYKNKKRDCFPQ